MAIGVKGESPKESQAIRLENLSADHFETIHSWFNKPHVQQFYSLRSWDKTEVAEKLTPYLSHEKELEVFVASLDGRPFGYVQMYPVAEHPWPELDLDAEVASQAAGIDFFIGEEEYLGQGLGQKMLEQLFESKVWSRFRYCIADPDLRNGQSIKCLQRCGFAPTQQISSKDALGRPVELQIMMKKRL